MKILYIVGGVLLFALATAVLYTWGLRKSMMQQASTMHRLRTKCANIVVRQLKKQGTLTEKQIVELIKGVKAGEVWSKQKAVVSKPKEFAPQLIEWMIDQRWIVKTEKGYQLK